MLIISFDKSGATKYLFIIGEDLPGVIHYKALLLYHGSGGCCNKFSNILPWATLVVTFFQFQLSCIQTCSGFMHLHFMKKILFLILLIPPCVFSQDIKIDETDGFTGQRYIETTIVNLRSAYTTGIGLSLSASGEHLLLNIVGYGDGLGAIKKKDIVYLLMEDGMIITASSIGDQPANEGGLTKVYQHHFLIRKKDLQDIYVKQTRLVRISTAAGNRDIPVSKKSAKELKKISEILIKALAKQPPGK